MATRSDLWGLRDIARAPVAAGAAEHGQGAGVGSCREESGPGTSPRAGRWHIQTLVLGTVSLCLVQDTPSRSSGTLPPPGHMSPGVSQPHTCQQLYEVKACSHSLQHGPNARADFLGFILHLSGHLEKKKGSWRRGLRASRCCSRLGESTYFRVKMDTSRGSPHQ